MSVKKVYIVGKDSVPDHFVLKDEERMDLALVVLPGVSEDLSLTVDLAGRGAELSLSGLYLCGGDSSVRLGVDVRHLSGGCSSTQLFKGIVSDSARFVFDGRILVERGSQNTRALQENHSILMSPSALAETHPQLEIYADDVECSHGATVGALSEEELFYMRSRGIPYGEARSLQMISFLSPVLHVLPDELRGRIILSLPR